jgi:hypothetical protein
VETHVPPPGAYGDEGRIGRGWRLTKVAWTLIRRDRTMLALAFLAVAGATFFTGLIFYFGGYFSHHRGHHAGLGLVALVALYPSVLVSVFFNVALASAASAAFDGERMSVGEALRIAWGKRGRIAIWALIAAFVGMLISEIASRLPGGAKLVGWLAGAAWGLATIFVIPILAMESVGALDAAKRSAGLVKNRWGEGATGSVAIGAGSAVVALPAAFTLGVGVAIAPRQPGAGFALIGIGAIALVGISIVAAATRQVFAVALYRYAIDAPIGSFSPADLEHPFTGGKARKKRKSWILRIGGTFLVLFALLVVVVAIFGPGRKTAAEGYFHVSLPKSSLAGLSPGSPVTVGSLQSRGRIRIGTVESMSDRNAEVFVEFKIDPRYRSAVEHIRGFATGPPGHQELCFGTARSCGVRAATRPLA